MSSATERQWKAQSQQRLMENQEIQARFARATAERQQQDAQQDAPSASTSGESSEDDLLQPLLEHAEADEAGGGVMEGVAAAVFGTGAAAGGVTHAREEAAVSARQHMTAGPPAVKRLPGLQQQRVEGDGPTAAKRPRSNSSSNSSNSSGMPV